VWASGTRTITGTGTDAINAASLASDVTTEVQSGLATASALTTVGSNVTSVKAKTDNLPSDPADASDVAGLIDALPTAVENVTALLGTTTADAGSGTVGRAIHYLRTAWASAGVFSTPSLQNAPAGEGGTGSFDRQDAQMIAAWITAQRGDFYPNRRAVWVMERSSEPDEGVQAKGATILTKRAGETGKRYIDFAGVLGKNEGIESWGSLSVDNVTIVDDSDEVTGSLLGVQFTGGEADDECTFSGEITTTEDDVIPFEVRLNVVEEGRLTRRKS
jgi:hypothetical protein